MEGFVMINSISYNPSFRDKPKFLGAVTNAYNNVMDTYDTVMEKKDDYIAVNIANRTNSGKRAGATIIGAASGILSALGMFGLYALFKKSPKLNNKLIDKFIVKKIDKWIERGKVLKPDSSRFTQILTGTYMKVIYSMLTGAATGFGWSVYKKIKNTYINGKISHTRKGAQADWVAEGLEDIYKTDSGKALIRNSIVKNPDKSVTVKFNGINREYTITKEELKEASKTYLSETDNEGKTKSFKRKYSKGDGDVLAFELAVEKYSKDVLTKQVPYNPDVPLTIRIISKEGDILNTGGTKEGMYYLLTGKKN